LPPDRPELSWRSAGYKNSATSIFPGICKGSAVQMAAIIHPLPTLLASLSRQELARQVTYLRAENQILRSRLCERLQLNQQEERKLLRHGKKGSPERIERREASENVVRIGEREWGAGWKAASGDDGVVNSESTSWDSRAAAY
jgi:hypothetical protein